MAQFIIVDSPEMQREVNRVKTFAINNVYDYSSGKLPDRHIPAGDIEDHVIVNGTIKIVYSVEIQPDKRLGKCHHLSVSKISDKPANPIIVSEIMKTFGMGNLEDKKPRHLSMEGNAINIVQPFEYKG